ncbi:MAG: protein tyrosine phosphatase family protein [Pseudomonadota bacterium]
MPAFKHTMTVINTRVRAFAALIACALVVACSGSANDHAMQSNDGEPVNYLVYDASFSSAGMPDAAFIQQLASNGVDHVINIAPPDADGSLDDEAALVAAANMQYLNIAVDWHEPTQEDVDTFLRFMREHSDDNVFLHCQMNMRATAFAMLHRVINQQVAPTDALADMQTIWTPNETWATLINTTLDRHDIDFKVPAAD